MKRLLFVLGMLLISAQGFCLEKLKSDYLIFFGNPTSPICITQYFSFNCPHCMSVFKKDFQALKMKYLETNKIALIFHPIPMDILTVQAMNCLEKLSEKEKRIFFEAIFEVIPLDDSKLGTCYLQKAMEVFGKAIPDLQDKSYLSKTTAFQDAFLFLKQKDKIEAVPSVEINGQLFLQQVPDREFLEKKIDQLLNQKTNSIEESE